MIPKLIKEIPKAIIISLSIFVILLLIRLVTDNPIKLDQSLLINFGYTQLYGITIYFSNAILFIYLDKVFGAERFTKKRILIGFLGSFVVSVLVVFFLRIFEEVLIEGMSIEAYFEQEKLSNYLVTMIITFVVTLAIHAFYFYKAYQESRLKEQKIIAGTANAKFESLKNQIDPHFLFNSLNVLSSLIEENPGNAQQFTTSLSKIYRYVLEQKDKELVTVQEELTFAKTYMNLLKMRFENSISFELPENFENEEAKIIPLSLQLLLENTIKHNVVSESKPLHIKIHIKDHFLIVENNLQKKETLQSRKGVGIQNIINRYAILTERKVLIEENKTSFIVFLPILTKQINIMQTPNEYTAYAKAKEQVEKLKSFYGNLASYCLVIPILILINLQTSNNFQWFWFPMLGWGLGVCFHAFETFGYGKNWEEKKIKEILDKQNNSVNKWN